MPSKIDPEPYFYRWKSVMLIRPSPNATKGAQAAAPYYQHRTCNGLVDVPPDRIPPKVCPECGADCVKEAREEEIMNKNGAVMLGAPERPAQLNRMTFPGLTEGEFDIEH